MKQQVVRQQRLQCDACHHIEDIEAGYAAQKLQDVGLYHVEKSGAPASSSVIVIPSRRGERRRGGRENPKLCAPGFAGLIGEIGSDQAQR